MVHEPGMRMLSEFTCNRILDAEGEGDHGLSQVRSRVCASGSSRVSVLCGPGILWPGLMDRGGAVPLGSIQPEPMAAFHDSRCESGHSAFGQIATPYSGRKLPWAPASGASLLGGSSLLPRHGNLLLDKDGTYVSASDTHAGEKAARIL
jgi:hypothetical protein